MSTEQINPEKYSLQNHVVAFVYELLSPAILGAMVYELLNKREELPRLQPWVTHTLWTEPQFCSRIFIILLFGLSWGYLRYVRRKGLKPAPGTPEFHLFWKGLILLIDFSSLIAFQVAFVFAGDKLEPRVTRLAIGEIAAGYLVIQLLRRKHFDSTVGVFAALAAITLIGSTFWSKFEQDWEPVLLGGVAFFYLLFLISLLFEKSAPPHGGAADKKTATT